MDAALHVVVESWIEHVKEEAATESHQVAFWPAMPDLIGLYPVIAHSALPCSEVRSASKGYRVTLKWHPLRYFVVGGGLDCFRQLEVERGERGGLRPFLLGLHPS